jgi:hypothetical protein
VTALPDDKQTGKDGTSSTLGQLRARHAWLDHLVRAGTRYTDHHGDHYAAAITFFSILSLVPLLMIAFAVAGYVLFFNPNLLDEIREAIIAALPPNLADTINPIINQAIAQRNTVAAFGLLTALYSGIGWMTNLREALSEQWAQAPDPSPLPKRLILDFAALLGLGVALVGSFAITGLGVGVRRRRAAPHRAGRRGVGAAAAAPPRACAGPRRELRRVPVGDRPPGPPAHPTAQRGQGGRSRRCKWPSTTLSGSRCRPRL